MPLRGGIIAEWVSQMKYGQFCPGNGMGCHRLLLFRKILSSFPISVPDFTNEMIFKKFPLLEIGISAVSYFTEGVR